MRTGLILDVCTVYLCIPLARTSRVCTMYIRRPYNMVGVHSYEHAQQPQTAAARACHPSAARLYSRHTGLESTEWVCCASSGGQAGRQAVSFFPHTPILAIGSPSRHPNRDGGDSTKQRMQFIRTPRAGHASSLAQGISSRKSPRSTVDTVVQNYTLCGKLYIVHDNSIHSPESRRYAALLLKKSKPCPCPLTLECLLGRGEAKP